MVVLHQNHINYFTSYGSTGVAINTDHTWTAPSGIQLILRIFGTNNTIDNAQITLISIGTVTTIIDTILKHYPGVQRTKAKLDGGYLATHWNANENPSWLTSFW
jgi:hypothetical protein